MKKYILFFLFLVGLTGLSTFAQDYAVLLKAEGDVSLYRNNILIDVKENMTLYAEDIVNTVNGTVLIQVLNDYAVITGKTAKIDNNTRINITEEELLQIRSGKSSINDIIHENNEASYNRNLKMNFFLILDISTSMNDVFAEVIKYIDENIINSIMINEDFLFLFTFGENTDIKINRKISFPDDYEALRELLYLLVPNEDYTDIGFALETLDNAISNKYPYSKSIIFFITDGINNPAENSKYFGFDVYKEGAFNSYTQVKSEDYKVMLLSIGEETAAKDLSQPLGGEYLEVSKEMDAGEINNLITDFIGSIEMVVPENVGDISTNQIDLKISFLSTYKNIKNINISSIKYSLDNSEQIFIDAFNPVISISGNDIVIETYTINLPENIEKGKHTVRLEVDSENNIVIRSVQNISFTYVVYDKYDESLFLILIIIAAIANLGYFVFAFFNIFISKY